MTEISDYDAGVSYTGLDSSTFNSAWRHGKQGNSHDGKLIHSEDKKLDVIYHNGVGDIVSSHRLQHAPSTVLGVV